MFGEFLKRLTAPDPARLPDPDARLALAALLVRIARSDEVYDTSEQQLIDHILSERYSLDETAATALRNEAEVLEGEAPDTVRFTRAIKATVEYADRAAVVESLWAVVLADGRRDHHEDTMLRLTANLLGVNDRDSARARQRVEARG